MEGRGIRSWEVILTYADTLHSYCAHTNVTISFCILADDEHIAPSSRLPSSSQRPRRQGCGTVPCVSRRVRKDHHQPCPHPLRSSRTRAAARWPFCRRHSLHTTRAPNRRCEAPTRRMLALSATKWSTPAISTMPVRWRRSLKPPLTCSHHLPANLPNAGFERRGESVKVRSGHKERSTSKRCSGEVKARWVAAIGHSARDIWATSAGSTHRAPGFSRSSRRMYLFCSSALRDSHRSWMGRLPHCVRTYPHIQPCRAVPHTAVGGTRA